MRILFTLTYYTPHWTGLTEHAKRLAEALAEKKYDVTVVATQHAKELPLQEKLQGVTIYRTPVWFRFSRTLISPTFFIKVWQEVRDSDVVIAYTPLAEIILIALLVKLQRKRLILIHNGDLILPYGIGNRFIEQVFDITSIAAGRLADRIIAYSVDYAKYSRFLSKFPNKIIPILPLFPPQQSNGTIEKKLRAKISFKDGPIIGFAGRFVQEKGFDILLQAIPRVIELYPQALFVFAGETKMVYEQFFEDHTDLIQKVQEHFFSFGRLSQTEMPAFYRLLDIFVLPSRSDCLAFVQVEAMLSGVPVVATDIPGARVPVKSTGMGVLVPSEDPEGLAHGIIEILQHKAKYKKEIKKVETMFDYNETIETYIWLIIHLNL